MGGFPSRITRTSFGPILEDKWPVVDPKHDVGEQALNLNFFQVAGMNTAAARGLLQVEADEDGATTGYQGLAWDPNYQLPKVVWTRTGAGVYTMSFPEAQYPDAAGNPTTLTLLGGQPLPQALGPADANVLGQFVLTGPRAGTVHLFVPSTGTKVDVNFLLLLW